MLCLGARCRVGPLAGRRALTPRRQDSKPMPRWVVQNATGGRVLAGASKLRCKTAVWPTTQSPASDARAPADGFARNPA